MIAHTAINDRIKKLYKGQTTSFASAELGKQPGYGVIVGREDYNGADGALYRLYQCGDPLGQYDLFGAIEMLEKI